MKGLQWIEREGLRLALHAWAPARPKAVLYYVHGLQSHAGWLFETGPALAALGIATYVLDRRGSGRSEGTRGDCPSLAEWLRDYAAGLDAVRARHDGAPVVILGQSFGGGLAIALAADPGTAADGLILSAPALGQWRARLGEVDRRAMQADRRDGPHAASSIRDEDYTSDPRYLAMIRGDDAMVRAVTPRFLAAAIDLEDHVLGLDRPLVALPSVLVQPRGDRIVAGDVARDVYRSLAGDAGVVVELPATEHYLEFGPHRAAFRRLVALFAETRCLADCPEP